MSAIANNKPKIRDQATRGQVLQRQDVLAQCLVPNNDSLYNSNGAVAQLTEDAKRLRAVGLTTKILRSVIISKHI